MSKGLGALPTTTAPANSAEATTVKAQALAITDTVSLADRADSYLATYGSDARFKGIVQGIKTNLDAKTLNTIGAGAALYTQTDPVIQQQSAKLENGTTRNTETTIAARTIEQVAAKNNKGIGLQRSFSETIIRESGGFTKTGQALASTVRQETTTATLAADATKGTLTQTFDIQAVITSSANGNTVYEQRNRVIVYSLTKAGDYQKSLKEVLTSITKDANGSVLATAQTQSTETSVVNATNGTLKISRVDESVNASNTNDQTLVVARRTGTSITAVDTSGGKAPTIGAVTVTETAKSSSILSRNDGTVDTSSTSDRTSTFKGVGKTVTSASTNVASQATWLKSDGSLGGGSTERAASFTLTPAPAATPAPAVLKQSTTTVAVANIGVRTNGIIDAQAYNVGLKTATSRGKLSAPVFSGTGNTVQDQIAAGTQNAAAGRATGPSYQLSNGVLTVKAATERTNSPQVSLDIVNRKLQSTGRVTTAGATVDGIVGLLAAFNTKGTTPLSVTRDQNDVLTAVESNPTNTKTAQRAVQAYQGQFALGTATKGVRAFTPVTSIVKLA
ncbi:hypothetical protein VZ95_09545 [Elstera litoralis]|uniref:Uncharacterized protein n=2 Tax=Elstera litoralis TaxID=552518 RepID=A0A0F3ISM3_9PROT|nr:hypothetical protein VZ95_09545 [Elstera litoralis]